MKTGSLYGVQTIGAPSVGSACKRSELHAYENCGSSIGVKTIVARSI